MGRVRGLVAGLVPAALATIVDLVGYGATANFFEGSGPAAAPSNTTAVLRSSAGCAETDDNAADFTAGAPNPRNTATASTPCLTDSAPAVSSTSPASGASGVAVDAGLAITFSEPVDAAGAWFSISCASSGAHTATVSGGPETFTLDPDTDFAGGETCTTTIHAGQVTDQDTDDPPDAMAGDFTFSFTTVLPLTQVHDIQGDAHSSPKIGQSVRTEGIVTARANGFYLQGTSPDASDATSEASSSSPRARRPSPWATPSRLPGPSSSSAPAGSRRPT